MFSIIIITIVLFSQYSLAYLETSIGAKLCGNSMSAFDLYKPKSEMMQYWLGENSIDHVLFCHSNQTLIHLRNEKKKGLGFTVKRRLEKQSPAALFTPVPRSMENGTILRYDRSQGSTSSPRDQTEAIFFVHKESTNENCKNGDEIYFQEFHQNVFSRPKRTGICSTLPTKDMLGFDEGPVSLTVLDYRYDREGDVLDSLVYLRTLNIFHQTLYRVRYDFKKEQFKVTFQVTNTDFFPTNCFGREFLTARIHPITHQVIAFYDDPKMSLASYESGKVMQTQIYNGSSPDIPVNGLCGVPTYFLLRKDIRVDWGKKKLYYLSEDQKKGELHLTRYDFGT